MTRQRLASIDSDSTTYVVRQYSLRSINGAWVIPTEPKRKRKVHIAWDYRLKRWCRNLVRRSTLAALWKRGD